MALSLRFPGKLLHNKRDGVYHCLVCNAPLFTPTPNMTPDAAGQVSISRLNDDAITYLNDNTHGMERVEIRCSNCEAHLGHVFPDGPEPTGERYCVNSASMSFIDGENGDKTEG